MSHVSTTQKMDIPSLLPIDWGIWLCGVNRRNIFAIATVLAVFQVILAQFYYFTALQRQELFLLLVAHSILEAFSLSIVTMTIVSSVREKGIDLKVILIDGMRFLPKVLISYAAVVSVVFLAREAPPFMLMVVFFIWAPLFCICEYYSSNNAAQGEKQFEDDDSELEAESDLESESIFDILAAKRAAWQETFFSNKTLFELGFSRSLQFSMGNISVTMQFAVLLWCASVLPKAIVTLVGGTHAGFGAVLLDTLLSSYIDAFMFAVWAGTFIALLPVTAREEIEVDTSLLADAEAKPFGYNIRLQSRPQAFGFIVFLAACCTVFFVNRFQHSRNMPEFVKPKLHSAKFIGEQFMVALDMRDPVYNFRWLDTRSFEIEFEKAESADKKEDAKPEQPSPLRVVPFDQDGKELPQEFFVPYYGDLRLVMYFKTPDKILEEGKYTLSYAAGESRKVYSGSYSRTSDMSDNKPALSEKS